MRPRCTRSQPACEAIVARSQARQGVPTLHPLLQMVWTRCSRACPPEGSLLRCRAPAHASAPASSNAPRASQVHMPHPANWSPATCRSLASSVQQAARQGLVRCTEVSSPQPHPAVYIRAAVKRTRRAAESREAARMLWPSQGCAWQPALMQAPAHRCVQMLSVQRLMLRP